MQEYIKQINITVNYLLYFTRVDCFINTIFYLKLMFLTLEIFA